MPEVPSVPQQLAVTPDSASLDVSWQPPADDGGVPLTSYTLEYRLHGETAWHQVAVLDPHVLSYTIGGLASLAGYEVRILASNSVGSSPYAQVISSTTAHLAPGSLANTGMNMPFIVIMTIAGIIGSSLLRKHLHSHRIRL